MVKLIEYLNRQITEQNWSYLLNGANQFPLIREYLEALCVNNKNIYTLNQERICEITDKLLFLAIDNKLYELTEYLISNNHGVNSRDRQGRTPLRHAVVNANSIAVQKLFNASANSSSKNGDQKENIFGLSEDLLKLDPNNDERHKIDAILTGRSPLHHAVLTNNNEKLAN